MGKHYAGSHLLPKKGHAAMKFTKDNVTALAPRAGKEADDIAWDESLPGFGLRFRGAHKSWICQYRVGKQQRREALGDLRKVGLEAARKAARQRFALVELNVDPKATKATADAVAAAKRQTLAATVESYLKAKEPTLRSSSFGAARRYFSVHWKPLATRPLTSIGRADVAALLREIIETRGRVSASRARAHLSTLFAWAIKEGLCDTNPAAATNDPGAGTKPRARTLDAAELAAVWRACDDDDVGAIVKLLILSGQRRDEIGKLRWTEVDLDAATITLPPERVKNERPHVVPLAPVAAAILDAQPRLTTDGRVRDRVFGGDDGSFLSWSNAKARLDRKIAASGKTMLPWTLHDLRRSTASGMQKLGIRVEVIERALNHVSGSFRGIVGVYQVDPLHKDVRVALERWAAYVCGLVEGREGEGNVVSMQRA
jgi:integrase